MARTDGLTHYLRTMTPQKPKQLSRKEINELLGRQFRRDMIARGLIKEEVGKQTTLWRYPVALGKTETVKASTKSEARSRIKERLGVSRLPPGFQIEKVDGT